MRKSLPETSRVSVGIKNLERSHRGSKKALSSVARGGFIVAGAQAGKGIAGD